MPARTSDIAGGSLDDHANVQIFDVVTDAQPFGLVDFGDGSFEIVSKKSGKCLDVESASTDDFANVQQFICTGSANQRWFLNDKSVGINFIAAHSSKCMVIAGQSFDNQAKAQQATCLEGDRSHTFDLGQRTTVNGTTFFNLVSSLSGKCLDVAGVSQADGAQVQQFACGNLADNQLWSLTENADGYLTIKAKHSNKCLDVAGVSQAEAAKIQQYTCNNGANQRWYASIVTDRHVQVVQVAQSTGNNRQMQDDTAITQHVAKHASILGRYGLRLTHDAAADKSNVDSDALFNLGSSGNTFTCPDGSSGTPELCAERYVLNWPTKLVILGPRNGSIASGSARYIVVGGALPSNSSPPVCANLRNTQLVSHLFGFFTGLVDTFRVQRRRPDSDMRFDPQQDPCLAPQTPTGTFNGATVDTNNVMSGYFNATPVVTAMQASQARAGEYVRRQGSRCLPHAGCALDSLFCELPTDGCTDTMGACTVRPTTCPIDIVPSCGCDGRFDRALLRSPGGGRAEIGRRKVLQPDLPADAPPTGHQLRAREQPVCLLRGGPNCVQRFSCTNGTGTSPALVCGF